jgi:hypothetical protein
LPQASSKRPWPAQAASIFPPDRSCTAKPFSPIFLTPINSPHSSFSISFYSEIDRNATKNAPLNSGKFNPLPGSAATGSRTRGRLHSAHEDFHDQTDNLNVVGTEQVSPLADTLYFQNMNSNTTTNPNVNASSSQGDSRGARQNQTSSARNRSHDYLQDLVSPRGSRALLASGEDEGTFDASSHQGNSDSIDPGEESMRGRWIRVRTLCGETMI